MLSNSLRKSCTMHGGEVFIAGVSEVEQPKSSIDIQM